MLYKTDVFFLNALTLNKTLRKFILNTLSRTSPGTLARDLIDNNEKGRTIDLIVERRVKLEGVELEEFERRQRMSKIEKTAKE